MAPKGEIAITLSTDEVQVLKRELKQLCAENRTSSPAIINGILEKLRMAEEKML